MRQFLSSALLFAFSVASYSQPLNYHTIEGPGDLWFFSTTGILAYSTKTGTAKHTTLDESYSDDVIADICESDDGAWISAHSGFYNLNLSTGTFEKISFPDNAFRAGKIAVDIDYVWIGTREKLWQFDKLGREWFAHEIPRARQDSVIALFSDSDNIFCVLPQGIEAFSVADEKWTTYPVSGDKIRPNAFYRRDKSGILIIDGNRICRFQPATTTWETIKSDSQITDIAIADKFIYIVSGASVYEYNKNSSASRRLPLNNGKKIEAIALHGDTLLLAQAGKIETYEPATQARSKLYFDSRISEQGRADYLAIYQGSLVARHSSSIGHYDYTTRMWETLLLEKIKAKNRRITWDDNGLVAKLPNKRSSVLKGHAGFEDLTLRSEYKYDTLGIKLDTVYLQQNSLAGSALPPDTIIDSIAILDSSSRELYSFYKIPDIRADLASHSDLGNERYFDATFNNDLPSTKVPYKDLSYQGNRNDRLNAATAGSHQLKIASQAFPENRIEGVTTKIDSRSRLHNRDRKIVRTETAAGYVTTQSRWEVFSYQPDNKFTLALDDDSSRIVRVAPGSVQIWVDGEELDSMQFSFNQLLQTVTLNRSDIADPSSIIRISYKIETLPQDTIAHIEFIPHHRFGSAGYASATVSPKDWIGARGSYFYNRFEEKHHFATVGLPLEYRRQDPNLFVRADPNFTYGATDTTMAGDISMQTRFGERTSVLFDGLWADSSFAATEKLTAGYGALLHNINTSVSHDLLSFIPLGYSHRNILSSNGAETRQEASVGLRQKNLPRLEIAVSRNVFDANVDTVPNSASDSISLSALERQKDKLRLEIYERSSQHIENLLHLNKFAYDLAFTEFRSFDALADLYGKGRSLYGSTTISPIPALSLTAEGTYRKNPDGARLANELKPYFYMQMTDLPTGIDLTGQYNTNLANINNSDTNLASIDRSLILMARPGSWIHYFKWLSVRFGLVQAASLVFAEDDPSLNHLVLATHYRDNQTLTRIAGVQISPISEVEIANENSFSTSDTSILFSTRNDISWWTGKSGQIETQWKYKTDLDKSYGHSGYARYSRNWLPWMRTSQGLAADYEICDSSHITTGGPRLQLILNKNNFLIFRKLSNKHFLDLDWQYESSQFSGAPSLSYVFDISIIIKPNIELVAKSMLLLIEGEFETYRGEATMFMYF